MGYILESWPMELIVTGSLLLMAVYCYLTSTYSYWKDRKVPFAKPVLGLGCYSPLITGKKATADIVDDIYKQFEGERLCGLYQFRTPTLMIRDLGLIERILIKDFSYFEDRGLPVSTENDPLSMNLVNLRGDQWRSLRHKLTPTFSSGKLKGMFQQMSNCGEDLLRTIDKYAETREDVDARLPSTLFSTEVIASCAFGLQLNSDSPEGKKYKELVKKVQSPARFLFRMFFPKLATLFRIKSSPNDVTEYFMTLTKATMEHRLKSNIKREDFFQLLLSLKQSEESGKQSNLSMELIEEDDIQLQYVDKSTTSGINFGFTEEVIAAQSFVFLLAGSESVATSISVVLHHLAANSEVQRRLQEEVDSVVKRHGGQWSYHALKEMTYLDQIIQESQRMFSLGNVHLRVCTCPYKVPDSDLVIEKGVVIIVPSGSIQMDPAYYPDPDVFNPDRFEGNNFKPSPIFSPFGDGPRICIAMRFAVLEMKVCIARIMSMYSVKPSSKTKTPLRRDARNMPIGGIWISFHKRKT